MRDLGRMYANGQGVKKDTKKAREWLTKVIESNAYNAYDFIKQSAREVLAELGEE